MPVTHIERRAAHAQHVIPPITDPMGSGWYQPDRWLIEIDKTHALMPRRVFDGLHEYSGTKPTGVYPGKMWKRHDGVFDRAFIANGGKPEWLLCWYGESEIGPGYCSNHYRKIVLSDGELP